VDSISSIARQGLNQAEIQLERAASQLAGAGASPNASSPHIVDISAGMVDLMSAQNNFAVNIRVMKTADEMQKYAIDILA
jgi:flagellar hook protein FlgE